MFFTSVVNFFCIKGFFRHHHPHLQITQYFLTKFYCHSHCCSKLAFTKNWHQLPLCSYSLIFALVFPLATISTLWHVIINKENGLNLFFKRNSRLDYMKYWHCRAFYKVQLDHKLCKMYMNYKIWCIIWSFICV